MSLILFTIYLDRLLLDLKGRGWVLWGPCFALRLLLCTCEGFPSSNGVSFNPPKSSGSVYSNLVRVTLALFFATKFWSSCVVLSHLGDKLMHNLFDDDDVVLKYHQND